MYVIINGVNSDTIRGLQILSLPPITKPKMRTSVATIDGRPGDIVTYLGYEAYNKTIKILLHDTYDLPAIMAYFNQSGTIIFSNDPDKIYTFETIEQINYERAVKFKTASVTIHVQPYKLSATEEPATGEVSTLVDKTPYIIRRTPAGTRQKGTIVGGSIVWNQLCNNASVTVANGHKYLLKKDDAYSIGASTGTALTGLTAGSDMVFDLTLMFGSEIADYIYTQEQATAGAGVALAKAWAGIVNDYYPYDAGSIKSVEDLTAHKMVGKNLLQLPNLSATYFGVTISASGEPRIVFDGTVSDSKAHAITLIEHYPMLPGDYILNGAQNGDTIGIQVYNATKGKTYRDVGNGASFTVDEGDDIAIRVFTAAGTSVSNMVRYPMIRFADVQDATFEPYTVYSYPLDSSLTLQGLPKLDGDSISYDGDIYKASGEVERRYGVRAYQSGDESDANVLTDGTNTVYKLTTPTTEQAEPYTAIQICDPAGTEEWVGASMPVGHETTYIDPISMTVTNEGNTESAPSITIEGEGTVEVTVDGLIAFEINMPTTGSITIDSKAMDATDGDGNLANRSVSGDYTNLQLAPGNHTVVVVGDVSNVTMKNVSRWL